MKSQKPKTRKEQHSIYIDGYIWDDAKDTGLNISVFLEDHLRDYLTVKKIEKDYKLSELMKP
jgi:post-segregation antitoxin (ccd killing protein)